MVIVSAFLMIKDIKSRGKENSAFSKKLLFLFLIVLAYLIFAVVMMAISRSGLDGRYYIHDPSTPLLLSRPFWEWQIMMIDMVLVSILCFIIPDKIK